ncbi:MAG: hypothetical protein QF464_15425, partial [Myxococcota bacterium]|nr:hypothetical protein [Myxococcota bacterium]
MEGTEHKARGEPRATCLEVHLLWRDTLIEAWHLHPGERLALGAEPLPQAGWPTLEWRGDDAVCVHEPAWSAGSGRVYTRSVVAGRRPLVLTPHEDFVVRARLVAAPATGVVVRPHRSFAVAACAACLLIGVLGLGSMGSALTDGPPTDSHDITLVTPSAAFTSAARALFPQRSSQPDVTAPILTPPAPSPRPRLLPGRHPGQSATVDGLRAFLDDAFTRGEPSVQALVETYLAADAATYSRERLGGEVFTGLIAALRARLDRAAAFATPESPVESLAAVTHALVGDASVLYRRERNSLSDLVVDGRLNCQGGSVAVALALLMADPQETEGRPVFVHTPGHVQPGLLVGERLHVVESTHTGARVGSGDLDELRDIRVTDARLELVSVLAALSERHRWEGSKLEERAVLFDRLDRGRPGAALMPPPTMPGLQSGEPDATVPPAGDQQRQVGDDPLRTHRRVLRRSGGRAPRHEIRVARRPARAPVT